MLREWPSSWEYPYNHPCWACLSVEWETQFLCITLHSTHSHASATKFHCGYNTTVSVCFIGSSPPNTRPSFWKRVNLDSSLQNTIDQSSQVQSTRAIASCNRFLRWPAVNRGFFKATCAKRPASLARLRTVLFDSLTPFCIHPILKCGTVSLLFCCDCLTTSMSSLCVDILRRPGLLASLQDPVIWCRWIVFLPSFCEVWTSNLSFRNLDY